MASKKSRSKSKQSRSSGNPSNYSQLYKGDASGVAVVEGPKTKTKATVAPVETDDTVNWQTEYAYVFKDLRFLFIVSLLLFAGMLVIGFFI